MTERPLKEHPRIDARMSPESWRDWILPETRANFLRHSDPATMDSQLVTIIREAQQAAFDLVHHYIRHDLESSFFQLPHHRDLLLWRIHDLSIDALDPLSDD
jgi:hypothetical protein